MSTFLTILAAFAVAALLVGVIVSFALLKSDHNRVPDPQSQGDIGNGTYDGYDNSGCGDAD